MGPNLNQTIDLLHCIMDTDQLRDCPKETLGI